MKLGMFTSGYQRNPLEHCFADAKEYGYDYIELWGGRPHAYAPDLKNGDIEIVKRLIDKYEVPVLGFTPEHNGYPYNFMIGSENQRQDAVDYLKLSLDMAKAMGADYMLVSPSHAGYEATYDEIWDRMVRTLRELTEHAEKVGVKLVVETLTPFESNAFKNSNDLLELFKRIDSPNIVGMIDIVPPYVQHESIMAYFNKLGSKIYHLHIVDGELGTDSHIMPGDGSIPIKELLYELKRYGYDGTATIELVLGYINEPRMFAHRAVERVRDMMQEVGF